MYFIFAIFSPSSNNKNDSLGLDYANDIYKDSSDYDSESKYSNNDIGYRYVRSDGIAVSGHYRTDADEYKKKFQL